MEAYEVSHIFFIPVILPYALAEIDKNTNIKRIMPNELNTKIASKKKFKWKSNKEEKRIKEKITDKTIYLVFNNLSFF